MPHIKVNNLTMYYEIQGQGEPVVLVSGFSNDHCIWTEVARLLSVNHQVILFDNRGAGQTEAPAGAYSIEEMADDVAGLCDKIGIKHAHFVGSSMGGFILQALAVKYPDLVKSLVMSNSTSNARCVFHYHIDAQFKLLKSGASLPDLIYDSCAWDFSYRFLSEPNRLNELVQLTLNNSYPFTLQGYEGQYAAIDRFDSSDWVHQIKAPTWVFGGEQDLIFSEASVKLFAEKIPNATYYGFKECGHLPMIEFPEEFSKLVATVLSGDKFLRG